MSYTIRDLPVNVQFLLNRAVEHYGSRVQEELFIGEIGELLTLFGRAAQGRATDDDWASELADVYIMLHQYAMMTVGLPRLNKEIDVKLQRLDDRMHGSILEEKE